LPDTAKIVHLASGPIESFFLQKLFLFVCIYNFDVNCILLVRYFKQICKLRCAGCLSLAELGRRGLLLPSRLPDG